MKFNKWSRSRIIANEKCLTSRTKKHKDDPEVFEIVGPLPLWFICNYLYRDEGAESPEQLKKIINQIFRKDVDLDREFYVHVLDTVTIKSRFFEEGIQ